MIKSIKDIQIKDEYTMEELDEIYKFIDNVSNHVSLNSNFWVEAYAVIDAITKASELVKQTSSRFMQSSGLANQLAIHLRNAHASKERDGNLAYLVLAKEIDDTTGVLFNKRNKVPSEFNKEIDIYLEYLNQKAKEVSFVFNQ